MLFRRKSNFVFVNVFADTNTNNNLGGKSRTATYDGMDQRDSKFYSKSNQIMVDLSKIELDLDEIDATSNQTDKNSISMEPLSASKLQLLQDTTMIESALDLDSLEESTSSLGANSHAGLIKNKHTL